MNLTNATKRSIVLPLFVILCIAISPPTVLAQYYNAGQEPASTKWNKIESAHFQVIFPEGSEDLGKKVAFMLDEAYSHVGKSLKHNPKQLSVILHTQTANSMAFVSWAPSRSEWFPKSHQWMTSLNWTELLSLHETRHISQLSKIEEEMPKIIRFLLGEQAVFFITGAYLPFWYIEGDATCNESGLSLSGNGCSPRFFMDTRAQLVEHKPFSFDKTYLGSYKDHVPDFYRMGYLMTGGARYFYKKPIWDEVVSNVAKHPFSVVPFNKGLKQSIGINKKQLFDTVYSYFQHEWLAYDAMLNLTSYTPISPKNRIFSNYLYGKKLSNGYYFAEKSCLNDLNRFVLIAPYGTEKRLFTPGDAFPESVSANDSFVVWSEPLPNIRWAHAEISILRCLNIQTGKLKEFRLKGRYVAPVLSTDHTKIAMVLVDNNNRSFIKIVNQHDGEVVDSYALPNDDYVVTPSWSEDGKNLIAVLQRNSELAIGIIDLEKKETKIILPFAVQEIKSPIEKSDWIYFVGGYTGVDNLYAVHITTGKTKKVTSSRFGIWNPSIAGNELTYSDYSSSGYRLVNANLDSLLHNDVDLKELQISYPVAENLREQEGELVNFHNEPKQNYLIEDYHKLKHIINVHSWAPIAFDLANSTISPGVSIMSQNILSTTEMVAGYKYDIANNNGSSVYANLKYYGWFPVIESSLQYGHKTLSYLNTAVVPYTHQIYRWNQTDFRLSMSLPLNLSKGKYQSGIQPALGYRLIHRSDTQIPASALQGGYTHIYEAIIHSYHILKQSHQDLLPNFGVLFDANYSGTIEGSYSFSAENLLYLPGLLRNHGLKIYNGYQEKNQGNIRFDGQIHLSRGHYGILNDKLYTVTADYLLPICYPDFNLGRLLYVKRIKAGLNYDQSLVSYTNAQNLRTNFNLKSCGFAISSDLHLLQLIAPLEIGFRLNYLFDKGFDFNFLFGINMVLY